MPDLRSDPTFLCPALALNEPFPQEPVAWKVVLDAARDKIAALAKFCGWVVPMVMKSCPQACRDLKRFYGDAGLSSIVAASVTEEIPHPVRYLCNNRAFISRFYDNWGTEIERGFDIDGCLVPKAVKALSFFEPGNFRTWAAGLPR